jgi:hypothetical protein
MKWREEITKLELEKLIHVTMIIGFCIGVVNIIILNFIQSFLGDNILAHIAVCVVLGILFGFILAKVAIKRVWRANVIVRPLFFDIQILENKLEHREDYDLVGEVHEKNSNS